MLDEFLSSVKGGLLEQISGKTDLDSSQLKRTPDVITDSFKDGLLDRFKQGQLGDIAGLLGQGGSSSPLAGSLVNSTVSNLVSKLGLSKSVSSTIATVAVPFIINKFNSFASSKGVKGEAGLQDLLGNLASGALKDNLLGGLRSKFGF
ncbi:MAG: hypothetical protein ACK5JD_02870 [Mangrovibacterium sp.]